MEPGVACQLWKDAPSQNATFSVFVGDDDTTTQAHLHQNVPYGVEKWSDVIHAKRSLTTRVYVHFDVHFQILPPSAKKS